MSSDGERETALAVVKRSNYKKPNFGKREQHMQKLWNELIKSTNLDVKAHVDKETSRAVEKIRTQLEDGKRDVTADQKDFKNIILRIKAINKKVELERKIRHMGIHEGVLRKGEMEEKLRLLNENIRLLATAEDVIEESNEPENEDEEEAGEGSQLSNKRGRNRRSVDAIHNLEDQLGLQISDNHTRIMNYKDKMHMSKQELLKSQESAEQFVAKMKEKQKEVLTNRKNQLEKQKRKTQAIFDKSKHEQKELEEKKRQEILEKIEKHKEDLEKEKIAREKREKNYKEFKRKDKAEKRLHEQIEERYKQDVLMPELERKKKNLDEIRKFHKPIKREELDEHEKNYQEKIKIEMEKQRMRREKWYSDIGYGVYDENRYKTKFYEKAIQEEKFKESDKRVASQDRKRKHEKMNNYAKIVKEMHWPQVSERKRKEMEEKKQSIENSGKPMFKSPQLKSRYNNSSESPDREKLIPKPNWKKFVNPMLPKPEQKKEPKKIDWLGDKRKQRQDQSKNSLNQSQAWKIISEKPDMDENTKVHLLKTKARLLEENAQRVEQMNKVRGSTMEGTVEVNELLINAIESKLSLLDNYM